MAVYASYLLNYQVHRYGPIQVNDTNGGKNTWSSSTLRVLLHPVYVQNIS